jgi:uncharacterized membrane protein required for colicin V production
MLPHVLTRINWVDIFVLIVLIRTSYIAATTGLAAEFFKLLGTIAAIYFSLHYYTPLSDILEKRFFVTQKMPLDFLDFLCFLIIAIFSYLAFLSLRIIFYRFITIETLPTLSRWGGLILGVARGFLLSGLLVFALVISGFNYPKQSVMNSYSARSVFKIAPDTYAWIWYNIFSKFMTGEKFNRTVLQVQRSVNL